MSSVNLDTRRGIRPYDLSQGDPGNLFVAICRLKIKNGLRCFSARIQDIGQRCAPVVHAILGAISCVLRSLRRLRGGLKPLLSRKEAIISARDAEGDLLICRDEIG